MKAEHSSLYKRPPFWITYAERKGLGVSTVQQRGSWATRESQAGPAAMAVQGHVGGGGLESGPECSLDTLHHYLPQLRRG